MKIAILNDSEQAIGGGWTFRRNLIKGLNGMAEVAELKDCDIALIPAPTMVSRDTFTLAKELGKKIVLRLDNVPRNSRNRNTGTSRLREFAQGADEVVFQSKWARGYLSDFIERWGEIVYNGIDFDTFNKLGEKREFGGSTNYLFAQYNRDETKRWDEAWYKFQMIWRRNLFAKLIIVGNFSPELAEYNFDFFRGEKIEYLGVVEDPKEMAKIYRGCDYFLATYFNDCYSNTYQEFLACGGKLYMPNLSGGTGELIKNGPISCETMAANYMKIFERVLHGNN